MNKKGIVKDFEYMKNLAEAKALSKLSFERPLTDRELDRYKEVMGLIKNELP